MIKFRLLLRVLAGIGILAIAVSQIGCSALGLGSTPTEAPTETPLPPTDTPDPTDTPEPTNTPDPTNTPAPTETPEPTDTPAPTRTPRPTADPDDSGGDSGERGAGSERPPNTPDAGRGQGVGEGQERGEETDRDRGEEAVKLDLCTLLTVEEVTEAVGSQGEFESMSNQGSCGYMDYSGETYISVNISAAQGDEAKWMLALLVATFTMFNGEGDIDNLEDLIEELQEQMEDMTVAEIVEEMLIPLYEDFGFNADEVNGIGDVAFWLWYGDTSSEMGIGELFVVRDDAYLIIDVMGLDDEGDSEDAASELAEIALDRLPEQFSVLPDDYENMLTPEP